MAAICKFYQNSQCRYGQNCRYVHPGETTAASSSGSSGFGNNTFGNTRQAGFGSGGGTQTKLSDNFQLPTEESIRTDLTERPIWILSSYAPGKDPPEQLINGKDISPEEVRVMAYRLRAEGNPAAYETEWNRLTGQATTQVRNILSDLPGAVKFIKTAYENRGSSRYNSNGSSTSTSAFGGPSTQQHQSSPFGNPEPSAFTQQAQQASPSPFAQTAQPVSAFGQPSMQTPQSAFGTSAFGARATPAFGQSGFGQTPATPAFGQPAFGATTSLAQPQGGAFGQSVFGQSSLSKPAFGQPGFGQPTALGQSTSPFSTANPAAAAGGGAPAGVSASPFGQTAFGQPSLASASPFAAAAAKQPAFGQPTFGQSGFVSVSPFALSSSQQQQQQSAFGQQQPANSSPFGEMSDSSATTTMGSNANPFLQSSGQNQGQNQNQNQTSTTLNPSPFSNINSYQQNQQQQQQQQQSTLNPFQVSTQPAPVSAFPQASTTASNTSPFGTPQQQQSQSQSPFSNQNPFQQSSQSQLQQPQQSQLTAGGAVGAVGGHHQANPQLREQQKAKKWDDPSIEFLQIEIEAFAAPVFVLGCVPTVAPSREMCWG